MEWDRKCYNCYNRERVRQLIEKLKKEQKNLNEKIGEKDLSRYWTIQIDSPLFLNWIY